MVSSSVTSARERHDTLGKAAVFAFSQKFYPGKVNLNKLAHPY